MSTDLLPNNVSIIKRFLTESKSADEFVSFFTKDPLYLLIGLFEKMDLEQALTFFTADALYRLGNHPWIVEQNENAAAPSEDTITNISHLHQIEGISFDVKKMWEIGDAVICQMDASGLLSMSSNSQLQVAPESSNKATNPMNCLLAAVEPNSVTVSRNIKNIWEAGDTIFCELEITYVLNNNQVCILPCLETIRMQGDKIQEIQAFIDASCTDVDESMGLAMNSGAI